MIPSSDHALLTPEAFERVKQSWRDHPTNEHYLAARQIIALETLASLTVATDPALADKPGSLARATGALDALCQLSYRLQKP